MQVVMGMCLSLDLADRFAWAAGREKGWFAIRDAKQYIPPIPPGHPWHDPWPPLLIPPVLKEQP